MIEVNLILLSDLSIFTLENRLNYIQVINLILTLTLTSVLLNRHRDDSPSSFAAERYRDRNGIEKTEIVQHSHRTLKVSLESLNISESFSG